MSDQTKASTSPVSTTPRSLVSDGGPMGWLRGEIDRLFDDFGQPGRALFNFPGRGAGPVPALEFTDAGKEYRLTAELPGLTEQDVEVELRDDVLTISGEKKEESESKENGYLLSERRYGSFSRRIGLPHDAKQDAITATFKDGVLTLTIAKNEEASPRARKIQIGK